MVGGKVTGAANWYTPKGYSDPSYRIDGSTGYWWVMPSVRFTYFNREKVRLFSSVAFGPHFVVSQDMLACDIGCDATLLGVSVGKGRWFGEFELGGLSSILYMSGLPDRWLNVSVGYRY